MVILHPDVINLSLGQLGGMDNEADSVYATVFKSLQDVGVTVNAAAGNHYTAGYGNTSGKNLPFASDPGLLHPVRASDLLLRGLRRLRR